MTIYFTILIMVFQRNTLVRTVTVGIISSGSDLFGFIILFVGSRYMNEFHVKIVLPLVIFPS